MQDGPFSISSTGIGAVIARIAFVSSYEPRESDAATFTAQLSRVTPDREIVAIHEVGPVSKAAFEVHHRIRRDERADYARTAAAVGRCADVVSVQFDPDDWGGEDGKFVLDFLLALTVPAVVFFHAVRPRPTDHQRALTTQVIEAASTAVVMSEAARDVLGAEYDVDPAAVRLLPYGVPNLPNLDVGPSKAILGLEGNTVLVGAGLLAPDNGFERVIDALPSMAERHPDLVFVVVGGTHPDVIRESGEAYRARLTAQAASLGVGDRVRFVDELVGRVQLIRWLQAADVVVTPYLDLGTTLARPLVEAMGAGRAVVATRYLHAVELLADDRGVLVDSTAESIRAGILGLLGDDDRRAEVAARAHAATRAMTWTEAGPEFQRLFRLLGNAPKLAVVG